MSPNDVHEKLDFARRRLDDFLALITRNALSAECHYRQQLIQEFFFHLIGAINLIAQLVNAQRHLGLAINEITFGKLMPRIPGDDPISKALGAIQPPRKNAPCPSNPYSDDGLMFRLYSYRNHVTHRYRNPFNFILSQPQMAFFPLDPRSNVPKLSTAPCHEELERMFTLVTNHCNCVISLL